MSMNKENKIDWKDERKKCEESPYYFATNYIKIKNIVSGQIRDFTTRFSEEHFNRIFNKFNFRK